MLYGRAGMVKSTIDFTESNPPASSASLTEQNKVGGEIYGAGFAIQLTTAFGIRLEYDKVNYKNFTSFNTRLGISNRQYRFGVLVDLL